jgi:hypothetical protein
VVSHVLLHADADEAQHDVVYRDVGTIHFGDLFEGWDVKLLGDRIALDSVEFDGFVLDRIVVSRPKSEEKKRVKEAEWLQNAHYHSLAEVQLGCGLNKLLGLVLFILGRGEHDAEADTVTDAVMDFKNGDDLAINVGAKPTLP